MAASTKDKIVDSSIALFAQKGYTETSIKEIAQETGIKQSSIYFHFHSKLEILEHILQMYTTYTAKNTPTKEEVDRLVQELEPKALLSRVFYRFGDMDQEKYSHILKIILHEQYRNREVGDFMIGHIFEEVEEYIGYVLRKLMEAKKIRPIDCSMYAKIFNAINIAGVVEYAHCQSYQEYRSTSRIGRTQTVEFVIDAIVNRGGL